MESLRKENVMESLREENASSRSIPQNVPEQDAIITVDPADYISLKLGSASNRE